MITFSIHDICVIKHSASLWYSSNLGSINYDELKYEHNNVYQWTLKFHVFLIQKHGLAMDCNNKFLICHQQWFSWIPHIIFTLLFYIIYFVKISINVCIYLSSLERLQQWLLEVPFVDLENLLRHKIELFDGILKAKLVSFYDF